MDSIRELLQVNAETRNLLEQLEAVGPPDFEVILPPADRLPQVLLELAVPHEDVADLIRLLPTCKRFPDLWWLLERCVHALVSAMGRVDGPKFPALPDSLGKFHRYLYIYVFLATLPHVREFHRARNIPDDISRLTLADLGRQMAAHRWRHGIGGLDTAFWLVMHFTGALYELGRLQFNRGRLGNRTGHAIAAAGLPYGPRDACLGVHIPAFSGPLTPLACDDSFARARDFFARHFPEETYDLAVCHSWLLDSQLAEYLPADSNIVQFQRRFEVAHVPDVNDEDTIWFVFGRVNPTLEDLPRRTALERAVIDHLKTGRHWHGGAGWLRLSEVRG